MRRSIALIVLIVGSLLTAPATQAQLVVNDPANVAVNIDQLVQHLQLIRRVEAQIRNQILMLQNWEFTRLEQIIAEMDRIADVLEQSQVYAMDSPRQRLDQLYPIDEAGIRQDASREVGEIRSAWAQQHREALLQARLAQNRAYESMPRTAERIREYLEQSSTSPGPTAAVQAGNEILATVVGQVQTLETLEMTAHREALEREAARQAEAARTRLYREEVMADWPQQQGAR